MVKQAKLWSHLLNSAGKYAILSKYTSSKRLRDESFINNTNPGSLNHKVTSNINRSLDMATQKEPNLLIPFFKGTGSDHQGRTLAEILEWPDELLEDCHDYIQTLFPLPEASRFSWKSALIDVEVFEAFKSSQQLRGGLRKAFCRMLSFYGLECTMHLGDLQVLIPSSVENTQETHGH